MKKAFSLTFVIVLIFNLCSCDSRDKAVSVSRTPVVCAVSDSTSLLAAREYCSKNGYELAECSSETDCAVMVSGGKYDYFIADEFIDDEIIKANNLVSFGECDYKLFFRMIFSNDNTSLCNRLNKAIDRLTVDGTLEQLKNDFKNEIDITEKQNSGKGIRVLCDPSFDERLYLKDEGQVCGFDADVVSYICCEAGFTPIFVTGEYDDLFSMLSNGEGDLILTFGNSFNELSEYYLLSNSYTQTNFNIYKSDVK